MTSTNINYEKVTQIVQAANVSLHEELKTLVVKVDALVIANVRNENFIDQVKALTKRVKDLEEWSDSTPVQNSTLLGRAIPNILIPALSALLGSAATFFLHH